MKSMISNYNSLTKDRQKYFSPINGENTRSLNKSKSPKVQINIKSQNYNEGPYNSPVDKDQNIGKRNDNAKPKRATLSKSKRKRKEPIINHNILLPKINALDNSTKANLIDMLSTMIYNQSPINNKPNTNQYNSNRLFSTNNNHDNIRSEIEKSKHNENRDDYLFTQALPNIQLHKENERLDSYLDLTQKLTSEMESIKRSVEDIQEDISNRDYQIRRLVASQSKINSNNIPEDGKYTRLYENKGNSSETEMNHISSEFNIGMSPNQINYVKPNSQIDFYENELERKEKIISNLALQNSELETRYIDLMNSHPNIVDSETPRKDRREPERINLYAENLSFKQENPISNKLEQSTKQDYIHQKNDKLMNYVKELENKLNETLKLNEELRIKNHQTDKLNENLNTENNNLKNDNQKLTNDLHNFNNNTRSDDLQVKSYVETISTLKKKLGDISEANNKILLDKELEIEKLKSRIDKYIIIESEFNALQNQNQLYKMSIENLKKSSSIENPSKDSKDSRELKELKESNESLIKVKKDLEFKLTQLIEIHKQKEEEIDKLKQKIIPTDNNSKQDDKANEQINNQIDELKGQNAEYAQKITMLEAKAKKDNEKMLQIKLESAKYLQEVTDAGDELMKLKAQKAKKK